MITSSENNCLVSILKIGFCALRETMLTITDCILRGSPLSVFYCFKVLNIFPPPAEYPKSHFSFLSKESNVRSILYNVTNSTTGISALLK